MMFYLLTIIVLSSCSYLFYMPENKIDESNNVTENNNVTEKPVILDYPFIGKWKVDKVENKKTREYKFCNLRFSQPLFIEFRKNGTFGFSPTCNGEGGTFIYENGKLLLNFHATTMRGCGEITTWISIISNNIARFESYKINSSTLIINCETNILYFTKH